MKMSRDACCSGEKIMRSRSGCLVESAHVTADCRQIAGSCTSENRLRVAVDVALHVDFADEVL